EEGAFVSADGWVTLRLDGHEEVLLPADSLRLLGPHNVANAMCAAISTRPVGGHAAPIASGLRSFDALEHRLEPIAEVNVVLWINDSKATNIALTAVALRSLQRPVILLLGGRHKGEPYTALLPAIEGRVRHVIAFGESGPIVEEDLAGAVDLTRVTGSFEEVLRRAAAVARPGDAVLLSPACSSYDMFTDFEDRGRRFRDIVEGMVG